MTSELSKADALESAEKYWNDGQKIIEKAVSKTLRLVENGEQEIDPELSAICRELHLPQVNLKNQLRLLAIPDVDPDSVHPWFAVHPIREPYDLEQACKGILQIGMSKDGQDEIKRFADLRRAWFTKQKAGADGPLLGNKFRYNGVEYVMTTVPLKLLVAMWGYEERSVREVENQVWPLGTLPMKIGAQLNRVNNTLQQAGYPSRLHRRGNSIVWESVKLHE